MRLGHKNNKPPKDTTIFDEMSLARKKALEIAKTRVEVKPIKYLLKR
ncbi:hypothetical protein [Flavobacterium covae]|nr:hypothetical protein [Flavobacterium covae]MCJ1808966.1 hypothetical protein [Flavobacterium covae]